MNLELEGRELRIGRWVECKNGRRWSVEYLEVVGFSITFRPFTQPIDYVQGKNTETYLTLLIPRDILPPFASSFGKRRTAPQRRFYTEGSLINSKLTTENEAKQKPMRYYVSFVTYT